MTGWRDRGGPDGEVAGANDLHTDRHEVMGFFSARRADDLQSSAQDDPSVVRVIRSRFVSQSFIAETYALLTPPTVW